METQDFKNSTLKKVSVWSRGAGHFNMGLRPIQSSIAKGLRVQVPRSSPARIGGTTPLVILSIFKSCKNQPEFWVAIALCSRAVFEGPGSSLGNYIKMQVPLDKTIFQGSRVQVLRS